MNLPTALVLIALIVILALVGRYLVRQRKNRCGSGCAGCPTPGTVPSPAGVQTKNPDKKAKAP